MKALAFDLGNTLVEYEGLPLSWEAHYSTALSRLADYLGHRPEASSLGRASDVLRRYNTRLNPRSEEVDFARILDEVVDALGCARRGTCLDASTVFFSVFRQRLRCFPDSVAILQNAKTRGLKVGVFTDVPYGMPKELVMEDIRSTGLTDLLPVVVTSLDAGFRKPDARSLSCLLERMGSDAAGTVYVGNERKDVEAALAIGCEAILLDRGRLRPNWGQHRTVTSLLEL